MHSFRTRQSHRLPCPRPCSPMQAKGHGQCRRLGSALQARSQGGPLRRAPKFQGPRELQNPAYAQDGLPHLAPGAQLLNTLGRGHGILVAESVALRWSLFFFAIPPDFIAQFVVHTFQRRLDHSDCSRLLSPKGFRFRDC